MHKASCGHGAHFARSTFVQRGRPGARGRGGQTDGCVAGNLQVGAFPACPEAWTREETGSLTSDSVRAPGAPWDEGSPAGFLGPLGVDPPASEAWRSGPLVLCPKLLASLCGFQQPPEDAHSPVVNACPPLGQSRSGPRAWGKRAAPASASKAPGSRAGPGRPSRAGRGDRPPAHLFVCSL